MAKEIINNGLAHNVLASGTKVKGIITSESDFRIDGEFEGEMNCSGKVVIGTQGVLVGTLNCTNAEIMGKVEGKINITEQLSLKSTTTIVGDIKTKTLIIEPDAQFNGTCDMAR